MTELQGVASLDDIAYDLRGAERRASWIETVRSDGVPPRGARLRDVHPVARREIAAVASGGDVTGRQLICRRPAEVRTRYQTLLHLETQLQADLDFGCLIASACQVLESEIAKLLVLPATSIASALVQVLVKSGKPRQAEILSAWAGGSCPATIGTASMILMAMRYGLQSGDKDCVRVLAQSFTPEYVKLASGKQLGATLDRLRELYRNPACHGLRTFAFSDYQQFADFVIARQRMADWVSRGPLLAVPPGQNGFLHHHLANSLLLTPEAAAPNAIADCCERLFGLAAPRASKMSVRLQPRFSNDPPAWHDAGDGSVRLPRPFRLGDTIRLAAQATQDCHLSILDVGTSGSVAVVLPNAWQSSAAATKEKICWLPSFSQSDFEFTLAGLPGRERILAIASRRELPVTLRPSGGDAFRVLGPHEIQSLCAAVEALQDDDWAACVCEFEIF